MVTFIFFFPVTKVPCWKTKQLIDSALVDGLTRDSRIIDEAEKSLLPQIFKGAHTKLAKLRRNIDDSEIEYFKLINDINLALSPTISPSPNKVLIEFLELTNFRNLKSKKLSREYHFSRIFAFFSFHHNH